MSVVLHIVGKGHEQMSSSIDDYIPINDAVDLTGYTIPYMRRMLKEGRIGARKFGRVWMVNKKSLNEYMENTALKIKNGDNRYGPRQKRRKGKKKK